MSDNKRAHPQMHAVQEGPPVYLVNLSVAGNYLADAARVMCKTMRAGLASRELTLEGSKDMCDFIAKALDETERAVRVFDDFKRGHSGKSPSDDKAALDAEVTRLKIELNVANAIIHDEQHGITAATRYDVWADELMSRYWHLEASVRQVVDGEISYGRLRELVKTWIGANFETARTASAHINRGDGFVHSEPAEECGCRFIGGKDFD